MKLRTFYLLFIGAIASQQTMADCVLDTTPPLGGGPPNTMKIPSFIVRVDADAPADRSTYIDSKNSSTGLFVSYACTALTPVGRSVQPPLGLQTQNNMFTTNIDGIEIKPLYFNSVNLATFPSEGNSPPAEAGTRLTFPTTTYFRVEVYKTKSQLNLSDPNNGDQVLPGGVIAYYWVNNNSPLNYAERLQIGEIRIISTPVCKLDGAKTIDFDTVGAANITDGVARPLNFNLTCATDYGTYSASASLVTQTPTDDHDYIKVTDNAGNTDRMKIKIETSNRAHMKVDGSTGQTIDNVVSNMPAQFNWTATLLRASSTKLPAGGPFNASAEILLRIN